MFEKKCIFVKPLHDDEDFKPVPIEGYEDYWISNYGRVYSAKPRVKRLIKTHVNRAGYLVVYFKHHARDKNKCFSVHRLVALTYISNPDNKPEVNHMDCNKTNPYYKNLEWCTHSENLQHAYNNGRLNHHPIFKKPPKGTEKRLINGKWEFIKII